MGKAGTRTNSRTHSRHVEDGRPGAETTHPALETGRFPQSEIVIESQSDPGRESLPQG